MKETTKVRWGFKGPRQLPLFMIWREYIDTSGVVVYAHVIFNSRNWLGL